MKTYKALKITADYNMYEAYGVSYYTPILNKAGMPLKGTFAYPYLGLPGYYGLACDGNTTWEVTLPEFDYTQDSFLQVTIQACEYAGSNN